MKIRRFIIKVRRSKYVIKVLRTLFKLASKLPTNSRVIVFESFLGKQYSDNPKAIYEYIKNAYPSYKLYWSVDRKFLKSFQITDLNCVNRFSFRWIYIMATAKYWVVNSRLPLWIPKPKHTIYIQTWHGTPLKKLGADIQEVHMPGTNTESYKRNFLYEAGKWDYLISPNAYSTNVYKKAFKFDQTIIESGYPRNDVLYTHNNESTINNLKSNLGIPLDKKVVLYAPTWRDNDFYSTGNYKFKLKLDLDELEKEFSNDFIIILRMHYLVAENFNLDSYENFVIDCSTYNDISHLYLISDVLITDYSSVFFDYANLRKPILFFTYDIDNYRDKLRGFYFNIEQEAPGPLLKTMEEIMYYLRLIKEGNYNLPNTFDEFHNKFCYLEDGNATRRVVESIIESNNFK